MAAYTASGLSQAQMAALKATADAMSAPGKGFLASDESAGPWLRAGHVDAKKIEDTAENRAAYRSMLYKTPGLSEYISGAAPRQRGAARGARGAARPPGGRVKLGRGARRARGAGRPPAADRRARPDAATSAAGRLPKDPSIPSRRARRARRRSRPQA